MMVQWWGKVQTGQNQWQENFPNCLYLDGISASGISVNGRPYKIGRFYNHKTKTIKFMDSTITTMNYLEIEKVKNELQYLESQLQ